MYRITMKIIVFFTVSITSVVPTSLQNSETMWTEAKLGHTSQELSSGVEIQNLDGLPITVAAVQRRFNWDVKISENKFQNGSSVGILWDLRDILNFTIIPVPVEDKNANGTDGRKVPEILNLLNLGEVELCISDFVPTSILNYIKSNKLQILYPTYADSSMSAIFQQPSLRKVRNVYIHPFHIHLWYAYVTILALIYITFFISYRCLMKTPTPTVLWIAANVPQQGVWQKVDSNRDRFIVWTGSLLAMYFYFVYSASLFAFLTNVKVPVKSIADLKNYGFTFVVHEKSTAGMKLIEETKLTQKIVKTDTASEVSMLIDHSNALISHWDLFHNVAEEQNYTDNFLCSTFTILSGLQSRQTHSFVLRQNSTLRNVFNIKIGVLRERGHIFRHLQTATRDTKLFCLQPTRAIFVSIKEVISAFFPLLAGLFASTLAVFGESIVFKCAKHSK